MSEKVKFFILKRITERERGFYEVEEGVGFEPTLAYKTSPVFKTGVFNHSTSLPFNKLSQNSFAYLLDASYHDILIDAIFF